MTASKPSFLFEFARILIFSVIVCGYGGVCYLFRELMLMVDSNDQLLPWLLGMAGNFFFVLAAVLFIVLTVLHAWIAIRRRATS
jgi:hypothetical protein